MPNNMLNNTPTPHLSHDMDDAFFEALRAKEYSRLNEYGHVYLDYTGGNLFAQSQLRQHHELLSKSVMGNPHSTNPSSQRATQLVEEARTAVSDFFNAEDYVVVFTQNASGALKIVGESYPFHEDAAFILLADNHNSVNGIRNFCKGKGGKTHYVPVKAENLCIDEPVLQDTLNAHAGCKNKLFAFPAQSNVSGVKHDLSWVQKAKGLGYDVLLDAAAFVPSSKLDLKQVQPDFVSVSFYKIFGYPTGIGCLMIHKDAYGKLQKPWFAGGTVDMVSVGVQKEILNNGHERFEDGTLNYLDIPAVKIGLDFINNIGIERINQRVKYLTQYLITVLNELVHDNGNRFIKIFGPENINERGGNVIINFFCPDGHAIHFDVIEKLANEKNISVRSGCFCNPGLDEIKSCVTIDDMQLYYTYEDTRKVYYTSLLGKMRGATRLSVGIATVKSDIDTLIAFFKELLNRPVETLTTTAQPTN